MKFTQPQTIRQIFFFNEQVISNQLQLKASNNLRPLLLDIDTHLPIPIEQSNRIRPNILFIQYRKPIEPIRTLPFYVLFIYSQALYTAVYTTIGRSRRASQHRRSKGSRFDIELAGLDIVKKSIPFTLRAVVMVIGDPFLSYLRHPP